VFYAQFTLAFVYLIYVYKPVGDVARDDASFAA